MISASLEAGKDAGRVELILVYAIAVRHDRADLGNAYEYSL